MGDTEEPGTHPSELAGVEGLFGPGTGLTPSGPATVR